MLPDDGATTVPLPPLDRTVAAYPMVSESSATGEVAAVYAAVLGRMPMVPSLFKSLAVHPAYLVLAWAQAAPALDDQGFRDSAAGLVASVHGAARPPEDSELRDAMAPFVEPLARMLLLTAGLRGALAGTVTGADAAAVVPPPGPVTPDRTIPEQWELAAVDVGRIRAALDTPIVNSIWRAMGASGLLARACDWLEPQAPTLRVPADDLRRRAAAAAAGLTWPGGVASPSALAAADIADAVPGMAAIMDAYLATLPRVLTLAASSAQG